MDKKTFEQEMGHIKFGLGLGAALRYRNELRAVRATNMRGPNLHEEVLQNTLGAGNLNKIGAAPLEESNSSSLNLHKW